MAEFCLSCWNQMNGIALTEREVILSEELDFCECCELLRPVLVRVRTGFLTELYHRIYGIVWTWRWR